MKIRSSLATLLAAAVFGFAGAQELPTVRAAMEAAGTFSWIVHGMDYFGTAEANGIRVEGTVYASKQATELALRGAEADVTVDDFLGSVLLRSRDVAVSGIYPYAKAVGGLVVPVSSDIDSIDDLRGRTIAAGSLRDKSLLILRALAVSQYGFDPQDESEIVAAAPGRPDPRYRESAVGRRHGRGTLRHHPAGGRLAGLSVRLSTVDRPSPRTSLDQPVP